MIYKSDKILFSIFIITFIVYLTSCFGVFDWFSVLVAKALYNSFGYTNRWSHTYGPTWFTELQSNISSFGSREIVFLITIFLYFFLKISHYKKEANNFLFSVSFGIVLILIIKITISTSDELTFNSFLKESLSNFPSGHAYIATVLYYSAAKFLSIKNNNLFVKKYLFISASILISLVGISRILGHYHTVTEVIAGWSLGLCWYSFTQLFLRMGPKSILSK